jgi:hypothetical protein
LVKLKLIPSKLILVPLKKIRRKIAMEKEILKTFKSEHAFRDFIGNHPTFKKLTHELKKVLDFDRILAFFSF